jgi:cytochrome b involved in lipid metabolism
MQTKETHKQAHIRLNNWLTELVRDFHYNTGQPINEATVLDLVVWAEEQTKNAKPLP